MIVSTTDSLARNNIAHNYYRAIPFCTNTREMISDDPEDKHVTSTLVSYFLDAFPCCFYLRRNAIQRGSLRYIESISRRFIMGEPSSAVAFSFTRARRGGTADEGKPRRLRVSVSATATCFFPARKTVIHVGVFMVYTRGVTKLGSGGGGWGEGVKGDEWMGGWMSFRADHRPGQGSPIFSSATLSLSPESLLRFRVLANPVCRRVEARKCVVSACTYAHVKSIVSAS